MAPGVAMPDAGTAVMIRVHVLFLFRDHAPLVSEPTLWVSAVHVRSQPQEARKADECSTPRPSSS